MMLTTERFMMYDKLYRNPNFNIWFYVSDKLYDMENNNFYFDANDKISTNIDIIVRTPCNNIFNNVERSVQMKIIELKS